jgi:hypothetical protein
MSPQNYWMRSALTLRRQHRSICTASLQRRRLSHHPPRLLRIRWTAGVSARSSGNHCVPITVALPRLHRRPMSQIRLPAFYSHSHVTISTLNRVMAMLLGTATTIKTMKMRIKRSLAAWPPRPPRPEIMCGTHCVSTRRSSRIRV